MNLPILIYLIPDLKCFIYSLTLISFVLYKTGNEINFFFRLSFTNCYVGESGSLHDARVFRRSEVGRNIETWIPAGYHILGDSAYPLNQKLIKPFVDNGHLRRSQKNFNKTLSKTRASIERSFGLLKGRFRHLKFLDVNRVDLAPLFIITCCVMHNMPKCTRYYRNRSRGRAV